MNVDLHCHSTASDGALSPTALVARAHEHGVRTLALTDHDTLEGLSEARAACLERGLQWISGVELSCTWGGATIHVLGYDFALDAPPLLEAIEQLHRGRWMRAEDIARRLAAKGMPDALDGARAVQQALGDSQNAPAHSAPTLPNSWSVPATSRTAARRFASGWAPANWATSSCTGRRSRKLSRPFVSQTLGSAWPTRCTTSSPAASAGA